ncbi:MAG: ABC transporter permease [Rhodoblastus sp.]|nr:ABC transporter permease [Rhodoblastus sp.]
MIPLLRMIETDDQGRSWFAGLRKQARVIGALMLREAMSRFGHDNLGFFWIVGEPIVLMIGVMLMWAVTGEAARHSVAVIPFALTGYAFITMWRHVTGRSMHCMTQSTPLTFHRDVSYFDVWLAKMLLECVAIFGAFMIAYVPFALLDLAPPINDPLLLVGGWGLICAFSISFGLLIAAWSELSELAERIVPPIMYITLPFTGLFYMVDWLPAYAQRAIMWSPLVSCIEMFRAGLFPPSLATHYDPMYVIWWCIGFTGVGLPAFLYAQRHVQL